MNPNSVRLQYRGLLYGLVFTIRPIKCLFNALSATTGKSLCVGQIDWIGCVESVTKPEGDGSPLLANGSYLLVNGLAELLAQPSRAAKT